MNKFLFLLISIVAFVSLQSCDNEVDISGDATDISVVYCLLDQSQSRHFVKLTRAFLIDGNVYVGAADPALSQYDPSDVDIFLDEYNSNSFIRTIPLDTVLIHTKDTGIFYYPQQMVYATPENIFLNENYTYELIIKIKSLDKELRASTSLVKDFGVVKPSIGQKYAAFTSNLPITVEWKSAVNGKLHQLTIRFFYTEVDALNNKSVHFVDLPLSVKKSSKTTGGEKVSEDFYGELFYQNLAAKIPLPANGVVRFADSLHYIFSIADETFSVYMDVNKPSTGIVTEKPAYTNIENGIGIFAGRFNKIRSFESLATQSLDTLIDGQYTYLLGFQKYPNP